MYFLLSPRNHTRSMGYNELDPEEVTRICLLLTELLLNYHEELKPLEDELRERELRERYRTYNAKTYLAHKFAEIYYERGEEFAVAFFRGAVALTKKETITIANLEIADIQGRPT